MFCCIKPNDPFQFYRCGNLVVNNIHALWRHCGITVALNDENRRFYLHQARASYPDEFKK